VLKDAIGDVLPLGIGVALSPLAIVAIVLMLVSRRARANGPLFVLGWLVGLAVVGVIMLAIAGPANANDDGEPAKWSGWLKIILGAMLVLSASRHWRGRPRDGAETPMPKWMDTIDAFTPVKAFGAGAELSGLNPKNLVLAVAAAAAIAETGISGGEQAVAYAVFAVLGTIGVAVPVVIYYAMGDKAPATLDRIKGWMIHNNAGIMAAILLVIGAKLIGDGIGGV